MNKELYNNVYKLPKEVLKSLKIALYKYPNEKGLKRAKNLVNSGNITYQNLKRLKNFFKDSSSGAEFELAGGLSMKKYIDNILNNERDRVNKHQSTMRDVKINSNQDKPNNTNITTSLHENDNKIKNEGLIKNVVAIIIDNDKRILLLKRSNYKDQWQPNKWSLVGGMIEDGESPTDALKREVVEETGLNINKFNEKFVVQRSSNNVEHIFTVKYDDEPENVNIDFENNGFGWFYVDEIRKLNTVPNLLDYVRMAIIDYE